MIRSEIDLEEKMRLGMEVIRSLTPSSVPMYTLFCVRTAGREKYVNMSVCKAEGFTTHRKHGVEHFQEATRKSAPASCQTVKQCRMCFLSKNTSETGGELGEQMAIIEVVQHLRL